MIWNTLRVACSETNTNAKGAENKRTPLILTKMKACVWRWSKNAFVGNVHTGSNS